MTDGGGFARGTARPSHAFAGIPPPSGNRHPPSGILERADALARAEDSPMRYASSLIAAEVVLALMALPFTATTSEPPVPGQPVTLFNGRNLNGWYTFIPHQGAPADPSSDPKRVFQVEGGAIHVSGEEFGCLYTQREFSDYRLRLEFKWGERKWPPRDKPETPRDSGVLVHCVGPDKVWPRSIECQIQEHDCGDFWTVDGATLVVNGQVSRGRAVKTEDAEKPRGEWNVVEVVCDGDSVTNVINGVVVNRGTRASVTRGKILLQSEGAEVFYRNITLTPLKP
jgi:hypothetical protein